MSVLNRFERPKSLTAGAAVPTARGAPVPITVKFPYQSFFSSSLHEKGLLVQPQGELIIPSTLLQANEPGFAVGLHPSSRTPIAIRFLGGNVAAGSPTQILTPGSIVRPYGASKEERLEFAGFEWGLPFGWLGGGVATIFVTRQPDADLFWLGRPEVIFHQQRALIRNFGVDLIASPPVANWPTTFPWLGASQGSVPLPQGGRPLFAVEPTRIEIRLRLNPLGAPVTMRAFVIGSDDMGLDSAGVVVPTEAAIQDITWGTSVDFTVGGLLEGQTQEFTDGILVRQGCEGGSPSGVVFVGDSSGDLDDVEIDIVRYGRL